MRKLEKPTIIKTAVNNHLPFARVIVWAGLQVAIFRLVSISTRIFLTILKVSWRPVFLIKKRVPRTPFQIEAKVENYQVQDMSKGHLAQIEVLLTLSYKDIRHLAWP